MKARVLMLTVSGVLAALTFASALGCATYRNETNYGLTESEEYLVTRPITRPVARAVSDQSLKLFRHYFSLSGMGEPAHLFVATWKHGENVREDFVVTESESGAISIKSTRGGYARPFEPLPDASNRNLPTIKRYIRAIRERVLANEPDARHIVVAYRGICREVYLHEKVPLSLERRGCALRRGGSFTLAVAEQRDGRGLPTDVRVTSWQGVGRGCSRQGTTPQLYLPFMAETTDGELKMPDVLKKPSPTRDRLLQAIADGLERLSAGKPGVDPATLYPEPTLLPESLSQQLEFYVALDPYVQRSIAVPVREAAFAPVERKDTLMFLGVPIEYTLSVRSDVEGSAPDDNGRASFHFIMDWTLTDTQGRQRGGHTEAKADGIVDESRVALITVRSLGTTQPLPSRYPSLIERLKFGIKTP